MFDARSIGTKINKLRTQNNKIPDRTEDLLAVGIECGRIGNFANELDGKGEMRRMWRENTKFNLHI